MKKTTILLAAILMMVTGAKAQKEWTLEDCVNYALEHNITLKKARVTSESAKEDVKESRAALLPSVSGSTNQSVGYRPWQDNSTTTVTNGVVDTNVKGVVMTSPPLGNCMAAMTFSSARCPLVYRTT